MKPGQKTVPELLAPAGNMEKLETAIRYGADAVYFGGKTLNLRAGAHGFSNEELRTAIDLCHANGVKAYYTMNVYPREDMLPAVAESLDLLADLKPDAIIASDPGIIAMISERLPDMPIHVSTQANTSNSASVRFWQKFGAKRVNVAREVRSHELLQMLAICRRDLRDMELEIFVHGAQCMAISGRCYMSAYLNDRPGNLGQCAHPCRYEYKPTSVNFEERTRTGEDCWVMEEHQESEEFTFEEPDNFTFELPEDTKHPSEAGVQAAGDNRGYSLFFAAQDLCLLHYLEWFSRMGVASIKLEGRTKSSAYLAQVVDAYRKALDDIKSGEFRAELYLSELVNAATRPLSTGFFDLERKAAIALPPSKDEKRPVLARLLEKTAEGQWAIEVKSRWETGKNVDLMLPGMNRPTITPDDYGVSNAEGEGLEVAHPGMRCTLHCDHPELDRHMFIRAAWDLEHLD